MRNPAQPFCTTCGTDFRRRDHKTPPVPPLDPETRRRRAALGDTIRALRQQRGWTQEELASRGGFDRKWINRLENGSYSPAVDRLYPLAAALEVPVAAFFPDSE